MKLFYNIRDKSADPFEEGGPAVMAGFLSGSYFVHNGITNLVSG